MFLKEFNQTPAKKIASLNKLLNEQFNLSLTTITSKVRLEKLHKLAESAIVQLRGTNKRFQLDPEYAKYLGLRDLTDTMLKEGYYAESPAYESMCSEMRETVGKLMDSGYTMDEACTECMNRYRMDPRWAYDDEFVMPIVLKAAKSYVEACGMQKEELESAVMEMPQTDLNERLLRELAAECGVELTDTTSLDAIEEKLSMFAEVSGKSRDAVVGFLNSLEEDAVSGGIQMFGRKVAEQNKFTGARKDAIDAGEKEFEVDGKKYTVTGDTADEKKQAKESMFDDLIADILNEQVDVEQAEVVMAVRALADDVQDQIERLGRMVNEDVPAIADQMRAEMGAPTAQQFVDQMNTTLVSHLEATRAAKAAMDSQIASLTGEEQADLTGGLGGEEVPAAPAMDAGVDTALGAEEVPAEEPAAVEDPMGRAEV